VDGRCDLRPRWVDEPGPQRGSFGCNNGLRQSSAEKRYIKTASERGHQEDDILPGIGNDQSQVAFLDAFQP
jgi:hypothetical protein